MSEILKFVNVEKKYGTKPVIKNLSFSIDRGKIIGLLGPNGSGKTTIIKLINGLLQPNNGEILINNQKPSVATKKVISYLPEKTYLNDWMKVKEMLAFFSDFYSDFDVARAKSMLTELKINENDNLKTMSKGTKEKVQLILVMSRKADLYILDEPIGGVDPAARDYILKTIISNFQETSSVIISTHLIQDVEQILDDIIFLSDGEIVMSGNADDIRSKNQKSIDVLFREVFKC